MLRNDYNVDKLSDCKWKHMEALLRHNYNFEILLRNDCNLETSLVGNTIRHARQNHGCMGTRT